MIEAARELIEAAERVVVLTGAGVSAESGVPTFRGPGGLWRNHRPEELATPRAFASDPRLVWEWYDWRRGLVAACEPNPAHLALAAKALARRPRVDLITQNVDGLHTVAALRAAGGRDPEPALPLELHGSLFRVRCVGTSCGYTAADRVPVDHSSEASLPRCPECGRMLRPAVVWFGESLDGSVLERAFAATAAADVCLVVGTSAVVHPAAALPLAALEGGGRLIEVNPDPTPLTTRAHLAIRQRAGAAVPELLGLAGFEDDRREGVPGSGARTSSG